LPIQRGSASEPGFAGGGAGTPHAAHPTGKAADSRLIRSELKNRFFGRVPAEPEGRSAGVRWDVDNLRRGLNADID